MTLMNMSEPLKTNTDKWLSVYYLTTCLILYNVLEINDIFKEYKYPNIFQNMSRQIEHKFKNY